jgi:hypothetical protein
MAVRSLIEHRSAWAILIGLAVLSLYWPALEYGYIEIDDGGQVFENPLVIEWTLRSVEEMFFSSVVGMDQPLTSITFAALVNAFGSASPPRFCVISWRATACRADLGGASS